MGFAYLTVLHLQVQLLDKLNNVHQIDHVFVITLLQISDWAKSSIFRNIIALVNRRFKNFRLIFPNETFLNSNLGVWGAHFTPPPLPPFKNSETIKPVIWDFAAFSNFLLEAFVLNLVSLTCSNLQILAKTF